MRAAVAPASALELFRPARPRLADAREALEPRVCPGCFHARIAGGFLDDDGRTCGMCDGGYVYGVTSGREAWELLATRDLVPMAWVQDPRRVFECYCSRCTGQPGARPTSGGSLPHPFNAAHAALFAADVAAITTVEAVALESHGVASARVAWSVLDRELLRAHYSDDAIREHHAARGAALILELGYVVMRYAGDVVCLAMTLPDGDDEP